MKHFAVLLRMRSEEKSETHRPEHLAYLETMRAQNKIFANGRFVDGWGGVVIYSLESIEEVLQIVADDPYIIHGARDFEIHEWDLVFTERHGLH